MKTTGAPKRSFKNVSINVYLQHDFSAHKNPVSPVSVKSNVKKQKAEQDKKRRHVTYQSPKKNKKRDENSFEN